jgi:putative copper export protein
MASLRFMDIILHWWVLLALVLLGGGFAYTPLVARSAALADYRGLAAPRRRQLLWGALVFGAVAMLLAGMLGLSHPGGPVPAGMILALRGVLLLVLAALLWRKCDESPWVLLPAFALLLTQSLASHSAALPQSIAPVLADWAHLSFTSLWLGGVAMFALVSVRLASPKDLGLLIARFSPLAMFCVLAVTLTGIIQSASFLGSLDALVTTRYGQVILLKVGLLILLIAFGAFHQQVISPRLQAWRLRDVAGVQQAVRRFRIGILLELLVSILILLAAGALTALPPAVG